MGGTKGKNINSMISKEKKDHSLVEGDETKRRYDNGVPYVRYCPAYKSGVLSFDERLSL
jgi:hypothetical protein